MGNPLGGKSSPPPSPNYTQAAQQSQTSQFNNQYSPYGSQVYSPDPSAPSGFQSTITLAPEAQKTLDQQMGLSNQFAGLAQNYMPFAQETYSKPMDMSSVPQIADQSYQLQTSRLDPQWQHAQEMQQTQLANQGLVPGGEAYDAAMRDFNQGKNDAYNQARLSSIQTMPQTYQLASSAYNQPLNTLNAIRTGAQLQNPQFNQTPGANYLGAAQAQGQYAGNIYNTQMQSNNSALGGLFGLGSAGIGAYGMMQGG